VFLKTKTKTVWQKTAPLKIVGFKKLMLIVKNVAFHCCGKSKWRNLVGYEAVIG